MIVAQRGVRQAFPQCHGSAKSRGQAQICGGGSIFTVDFACRGYLQKVVGYCGQKRIPVRERFVLGLKGTFLTSPPIRIPAFNMRWSKILQSAPDSFCCSTPRRDKRVPNHQLGASERFDKVVWDKCLQQTVATFHKLLIDLVRFKLTCLRRPEGTKSLS